MRWDRFLAGRRWQIRAAAVAIVVAVAVLIVMPILSQSAVGGGQHQAQDVPARPSDGYVESTAPESPPIHAPRIKATDIAPDPEAMTEITPAALPEIQVADRLNILLLGIDQRPKQDPDKVRTDTMIVMTLDTAAHTAGMLSIPRDLYVPLPGRGHDRINTAHVYGGPAYAMRAVASNFGIPIHHYVRVNFVALTTLVDLVGGIDVYVDQDINDRSYPDMNYGYDPFVISKGWHHLDGAAALKYARTRHGSSDFYRLRRQQQIIMALRNRVLNGNALAELLLHAPRILETLRDSISTDLSLPEILQFMLFAKDLSDEQITRVVVNEGAVRGWTTPQGAQVLIPNRGRLRELAEQLYRGTPQTSGGQPPQLSRQAVEH